HRDPESLEGLVDLLVDVRLLLGRVLDAVSRLVEVPTGSPSMEGRVHRILPVRRVGVLVRILQIPLRGTEASVPFSARFRGEGNPESQYAHWMERAHAEWIVLNRAINGQTAGEIRARFERDVVRAKPAYVIILAGVNDIFGGGDAEAVERERAVMYADALDSAIVPVAASVLPYDQATPQATAAIFTLNMWIESFAKVLDIPFADTHAAV